MRDAIVQRAVLGMIVSMILLTASIATREIRTAPDYFHLPSSVTMFHHRLRPRRGISTSEQGGSRLGHEGCGRHPTHTASHRPVFAGGLWLGQHLLPSCARSNG